MHWKHLKQGWNKNCLLHYECSSAHCCVSAAVFGCEKHDCDPLPFLPAYFDHLWYLHFSENEIAAARLSFHGYSLNSGRIAIICMISNSFAGAPAVPETVDLPHKLGRGLFWQEQQQTVTELSMYFVTNSIWELVGTSLYIQINMAVNNQGSIPR